MTAEEYVVEQIKEKDKVIQDLQKIALEQQVKVNDLENAMRILTDYILLEESSSGRKYYTITVWDDKDGFTILDNIMKVYGAKDEDK